ncbi:hypothetical protein CYV19_12910 [Natronobacterium gregoryi SP2]|uniref:Uncharacterized protein n=2 Tax=Natronobacterium gregoryi TaxID=44930 RepID=L9YFU4_NATGS|nr:hypothetical protein C490_03193 [Natronobacterium gregoryi SP2]PLK19803.1 hypothetical protein CYV19_12910 [Natronobacterium gregoryi SP2]
MPRINVTVDDEQKDRWDSHVEEDPTVSSLSEMVRTAVERYITSDDSSPEGLNNAVDEDMMELLESIDSRTANLENSLDKLHRRTVHDDEIEDIVRLHTEQLPDIVTMQLLLKNLHSGSEPIEAEDIDTYYDEPSDELVDIAKLQEERRKRLNERLE